MMKGWKHVNLKKENIPIFLMMEYVGISYKKNYVLVANHQLYALKQTAQFLMFLISTGSTDFVILDHPLDDLSVLAAKR